MSQTKAQLVQPVGIVTGTGINVTGVITATSFVGSGEGLTGVASTDNIITGTAATFNNTVNVNSSLNATRFNVTGVGTIASAKIPTGFTTNAINTNLTVTGITTLSDDVTFTGAAANVTWDKSTDDLIFNDNAKAVFGSSSDGLEVYHDSNNSYIADSGTGDLRLRGSKVVVQNSGGSASVLESNGNSIELYFNNSKKIETMNTGAAVVGVVSATSFTGDGSALTGVGESIAPWYYNPDVNDVEVTVDTGIGITFNKKVLAGSGTATIKIVNAGVAGTTVQSWGVSSCTFATTVFSLGALVSDLPRGNTYQLDIPSGFIVESAGASYAGTAYTFAPAAAGAGDPMTAAKTWAWGRNIRGALGTNDSDNSNLSSPKQVPGTTWGRLGRQSYYAQHYSIVKTDNTLYTWGTNNNGALGTNQANPGLSSPVQVPGTTWAATATGQHWTLAVKTNGTLWAWGGQGGTGALGQNNAVQYSSPVQIGSDTDWAFTNNGVIAVGRDHGLAIKQNGTLWAWGANSSGQLGKGDSVSPSVQYSSPVQVGSSTDWEFCAADVEKSLAINTSDELWTWGKNQHGQLGMNMAASAYRSSPIQVPGSWKSACFGDDQGMGIRTNGTLFAWGNNNYGQCAQNSATPGYSSPIQIPGTTWSTATRISNASGSNHMLAMKTDGTLWAWGRNNYGYLGQNNTTHYSSPVQVMSYSDVLQCDAGDYGNFLLENS